MTKDYINWAQLPNCCLKPSSPYFVLYLISSFIFCNYFLYPLLLFSCLPTQFLIPSNTSHNNYK